MGITEETEVEGLVVSYGMSDNTNNAGMIPRNIAIAVPVATTTPMNHYDFVNNTENDDDDDEELDPIILHQRVQLGTQRGHMLRDIEIERDKLAQRLALQQQEMELQTNIALGQAMAKIRNQQGFPITSTEEEAAAAEEINTQLKRDMERNGMPTANRRVTYSNVPGGGYDVQPYHGLNYDDSNYQYDTQYEYKSVYEE